MSDIKPTQKIYDVVKEIRENKYMLPSIQRSFVWKEEKICKLMDSLMNNYPIGSLMVWKPSRELEMRIKKFLRDYTSGIRLVSEEKLDEVTTYLVLDGQQRLQSLYLGFFGSFDNKRLYFKVNSDVSDEEDGLRYQFKFFSPRDVEDIHWKRLDQLIEIQLPKISSFVNKEFKDDPEEVKETIAENLLTFIQVFNIEERIFIQEVKEGLPYNDVLEVFVRVNSGGMVLTKSDLVFSTVILNSPDAEKSFIELVDELNGSGDFEFDIDFVIKTSFVLFDKGAKYDVDKLKDRGYLRELKHRFSDMRSALLSTMEFLKSDAKIHSKRFLKSDLALVPIIDFIYRQPHQQLPEGQARRLCQYLYMSFFMRLYSYSPDGKLDRIHKMLNESEKQSTFPRKAIGRYMQERTAQEYRFSKAMLKDLDSVLNIIQGGVYQIPQLRGWSLERDHIIPRSILEKRSIPDDLISNVGNLRLINKTRNILKSDSMPEPDIEFFGADDEKLNKAFLKCRSRLSESTFRQFVEMRQGMIFDKVMDFLGVFGK